MEANNVLFIGFKHLNQPIILSKKVEVSLLFKILLTTQDQNMATNEFIVQAAVCKYYYLM
jgi:hypothetical protein